MLRLMYRAASVFYGTADELHRPRDYLMPVPFDPASNLFGHSDVSGLTKTNGDQANWAAVQTASQFL